MTLGVAPWGRAYPVLPTVKSRKYGPLPSKDLHPQRVVAGDRREEAELLLAVRERVMDGGGSHLAAAGIEEIELELERCSTSDRRSSA